MSAGVDSPSEATPALPIYLRLTSPVLYDPADGVTRIAGPRSELRLRDEQGVIASHLQHFTGFTTTLEVTSALGKAGTLEPSDTKELIWSLIGHEVLLEPNMQWRALHSIAANPQSLGQGLSRKDREAQWGDNSWQIAADARPSLGPLQVLAAHRRSVRRFDPSIEVGDQDLRAILRVAYSAETQATPSAGGLNPCRISILQRHDNSLIHLDWDHRESVLIPTHRLPLQAPQVQHALESEDFLGSASAVIAILIDPSALSAKYGNRGYRYALLDAGHIAQMVHLAAVEKGLRTLEWGAFRDEPLAALLRKEPDHQPVALIAVGREGEPRATTDNAAERELADYSAQHALVREISTVAGSILSIAQIENHESTSSTTATGSGWTRRSAQIRAAGEYFERRASTRARPSRYSTGTPHHGFEPIDVQEYWPVDHPIFSDAERYKPFDPEDVRGWFPATSASGKTSWVPVDMALLRSSKNSGGQLCAPTTSNGVASGRDWPSASRAAFLELVERDAFMRHWIEQSPPAPLEHDELEPYRQLVPNVSVLFRQFDSILPTVGVFLLTDNHPAVTFGLKTHTSLPQAADGAFREAVATRYLAPAPSATLADFEPNSPREHAEFYFEPRNKHLLENFLHGRPTQPPARRWSDEHELHSRTILVNLTLKNDPVTTVRALNPLLEPIWFKRLHAPSRADGLPPHPLG